MARPQQEILLSINDEQQIDVIASQGLWAVLYQLAPCNIRKKHYIMRGETHKYFKMVYPNHAHAYRTADRLNKMFNTAEFTVKKIL